MTADRWQVGDSWQMTSETASQPKCHTSCLHGVTTRCAQAVLPSNNFFTAMNTNPRFKCSQCKKYKLSDEYGTRQKGGSHGQEVVRLALCLSCNGANRKRKRNKSGPDHPVKQFTTEPPTSLSQFMEALAKHASASEIDTSWRVSLDEITLTDKGIGDHIASLAWKATGYRFR